MNESTNAENIPVTQNTDVTTEVNAPVGAEVGANANADTPSTESTESKEVREADATTPTSNTDNNMPDYKSEKIEDSNKSEDKTEDNKVDGALDWDDKWIKDYAPDICDDGIKQFKDVGFKKAQAKYIVDYINKFKVDEKARNEKSSKRISESFNEKSMSEIQAILKSEFGNKSDDVWNKNKYNYEFISVLNKLNTLSKPKQFVKSTGNNNVVTKETIEKEKSKLMSSPHYRNNDNPVEHEKVMNRLQELISQQIGISN